MRINPITGLLEPESSGLGEQGSPDASPDDVGFNLAAELLKNKQEAASPMAPAQPAGGGGADTLGKVATTAGVATANPVLAGAGLALTTLAQIGAGRRADRWNRYNAKVQEAAAKRSNLNQMAQIGTRMGNIT